MPKLTARERNAASRRWDRAFGRALAGFRDERGLSQLELAHRMGWAHRTTVAKIEAGERPAKQSEVRLLAQVLDVRHEVMMKVTETWFTSTA